MQNNLHLNPLYCIVGRTASGKDSITDKLCENLQCEKVLSYATRPKRTGEGNTHIFINKEDVHQYKSQLAAYTKIGEYEYFTTFDQLCDPKIKFYIIDPVGVQFLKSVFKYRPIYVIYVNIDSAIAFKRGMERGDDKNAYLVRAASEDMQFSEFAINQDYDFMIMNYDFTYSIEQITDFIYDVERTHNPFTFTMNDN